MKNIPRLFLFISLVIIDQLSKYLVLKSSLEYTLNYKGSWGVLPWWSGIVGIILMAVIGFRSKLNKCNKLLYIVIMVGGIANVIDRIIYGGVVDFIRIGNFPYFNLADIMVCSGVAGLIWRELKK